MTQPEVPPEPPPYDRPGATENTPPRNLDDAARRALLEGTARPARPPSPTLAERVRAAPVTYGLIAVNVVVFVWAESASLTVPIGLLLHAGASEQLHVWSGEYWRLVTPMFIHVGLVHLAWNAYASIGWCVAVERALGKARFLAVYLASGVGGSALSVIGHPAVSAGASGAMFGIVGATIMLRRRMLPSWRAMMADPPTRAVLGSIALWGLIGLGLNVDNFAHLGGLLTGAAMTWILSAKRSALLGWAAFGVGYGALLVLAMRPGWHPKADDVPDLLYLGKHYACAEEGYPRNEARAAKFFRLACEGSPSEECMAQYATPAICTPDTK